MLLAEGLSEHVKWGHPTYMHAGRNVAMLGAFRDDHRLTFMDGALLKDPQGLLETAGPNSEHPTLIRFTALGQVAARGDHPGVHPRGHGQCGPRPAAAAADSGSGAA